MKSKIKSAIVGVLLCVCFNFGVSCAFIGYVGDDDSGSDDNELAETFEESDTPDETDTEIGIEIETETDSVIATEPEISKVLSINSKFDEYLNINEDVVGWIKIEGTNIDAPVVFMSGDNDYYLTHNINKQYSEHGSIFMDMTSHGALLLEKNTIIHGHNFYDNKIFSQLESFKKKDFFDYYKTIKFDNLYSDMEWEVFAVYVIHADNYFLQSAFESDDSYFEFIDRIKSIAIHWRDFTPSSDDHILSLNTCSGEFEDAHTIIHAKLVKKSDNWVDANN